MRRWWQSEPSERPGAIGDSGKEAGIQRKASPKRRSRFWKTVTYLRVARVETQGQAISAMQDHQTLVLVTNGRKPKWLQFRCPCGCGDLLRMSLSPLIHPCWRLRISRTGKLSLFPSINRDSGCGAHFFLTSNVARLL
jgi:hypothetical protein